MAEGGSYIINENGERVLRERTGAVVTTAEPEPKENTSEVTEDEDA